MKKKYFKKKDILDIGCNAGYFTISLAEHFHPKMILGIDIDGILIHKARKVLVERNAELSGHGHCDSRARSEQTHATAGASQQ